MAEQLAVISEVGVGLRDVGHPILWFDSLVSEATGALQIFDWGEAYTLLQDYGVYDVYKLNGKHCWVEVNGNNIKFLRPAKIDVQGPAGSSD